MEAIKYAKSVGANAIAHGSTGAGNDQIRFDLIFQTIAPEIEIITPIRDLKLSRQEEVAYLQANGVEYSWEKAQYSINKGLWGTSVGGKETLTSNLPLPSEAYPSQLQKEGEEKVTLHFEKGQLVGINNKMDSPVKNIVILEKLASAFAIGRDIHVGDTIIGIKGRVGFEAAAPLIIIKAHHLLEKHTLGKWQQYWKEQLGNWYGMLFHEGQFLDPVMRNIETFLESTQETVNGTVTVSLKPYHFSLDGIESKNDLMNTGFGQYGEMNNAWTSDDAKGFIKILGNAQNIFSSVNNETYE
jgi:argininosuccinate synthase